MAYKRKAMLNKPKYNFFANTLFALKGFWEVLKHETSFQIEMAIIIPLWILIPFFPMALAYKLILALALFIPLIAEMINSAIERIVDLASPNYHELAKRAKDAGATVVFLSIALTVGVWLSVIVLAFA